MMTQAQVDQMIADMARLKAENEQLKTKKAGKPSFKVSEKGAVSVYGLGRFPVTLYREQWGRLIGVIPELQAFIEANASKLSTKKDGHDKAAAPVTTPVAA